ncbi:hypothetical protein [Streptosporangium sp. KLBMP 9127]|nr:hypothetical protein [Streptosporangium sp. KLBMP 9127]
MSRTLATATLAAVLTTALAATPATAASTPPPVLYGFAWADGAGTLRITPAKAKLVKQYGVLRHRLTPIPGAKERRIGYRGADFRRVTAECDLKETEGVVKVDKKGLGTTRCADGDLTFALRLDPVPVRVSLGATTRIHELLADQGDPTTALGTIKRVTDTTLLFTRNGKTTKLGYTALSFSRVTRKCGDRWLSNHVNAGRDGLGTKDCRTADFTKALKRLKYPVLAKVDHLPLSGNLIQVWEVFGDA